MTKLNYIFIVISKFILFENDYSKLSFCRQNFHDTFISLIRQFILFISNIYDKIVCDNLFSFHINMKFILFSNIFYGIEDHSSNYDLIENSLNYIFYLD